MSYTKKMIDAIQSCRPEALRLVLRSMEQLPDRVSVVNAHLEGPVNITPLHLAAKAYAAYADNPLLGCNFDRMVSDLLDAGACPWVEAGTKRWTTNSGTTRTELGQTVVEACDGKVPPSLQEWIRGSVKEKSLEGFSVKRRVCEMKISKAPRAEIKNLDALRQKIVVLWNQPSRMQIS